MDVKNITPPDIIGRGNVVLLVACFFLKEKWRVPYVGTGRTSVARHVHIENSSNHLT